MENMNLASRCRQAISEAADLKRKVGAYEKRHGEFGNLQKEVLLLRRQIERQHGNTANGSSGGGAGVVGGGGEKSGGKGGRNRSISPKPNNSVKQRNSSGNDGVVSSNTTPMVDEKKKKRALLLASSSATTTTPTLETKGSGETTDLDRIMAQELFKKNNGGGAAAAASTGMGGSILDGGAEKKDGSANAVTKKFQELNISTTNTSNSTSNIKSGGGSSNNNKVTSSSSTFTNNATSSSSSSKRPIIATTTTTSSSLATDGTNNNNSNTNISSANTKIPISVTANNATTQKDDDEFDAEIDMVDFFAKSSQSKLGASPSTSSANSNTVSSNGSGVDGIPSSSRHSRSHITHKLKKTVETDDHMPEELVGPTEGRLLSPSSSSSKKNVGDNLLSSLDAFEASFASAFPETSFSIKSAEPSSSTQLDMSFDVPVFDPFFKSPANRDSGGGGGTAALSSSLQSSPPKSKSASSSGGGAVATGSGNNPHKDGMKSQLKDLFPDSALTTSPKRGLDLTFDSTFADVDIGGGNSNNKSGKGKSSLSADKLDSAFSRAHSTTPTKTTVSAGSGSGSNSSSKLLSLNRPAPLDMSAEIEQLDALASATEKADGGGGVERKRSVRKVKTPLSYAEPSTKQKLRRGDVLFPKIDADRKLELEAKRSKSGGAAAAAAGGAVSPTTDLDRIMSEHFSVSNNKKDGTAPS